MRKTNMGKAVTEVILCAGRSGRVSVPAIEMGAIIYASANGLDVIKAVKISYEAIKRCCTPKEARFWGYNAW